MKKTLVKLFVVLVFSFCTVFVAEGTSNANERNFCADSSHCPPGMCCSITYSYCIQENSFPPDCM